MASETMEMPAVDRLDVEHRDKLQIELMRQMLGEKPDHQKQLEWVLEYGKKVSDLIDYHEHDEIRSLALAENYIEAAALLKELL